MLDHLQRAYKKLNDGLFDGALSPVVFVLNLNLKSIFLFLPPNIIQAGSKIATATPSGTLDDLVHAMIHIYNYGRGFDDCSSANKYHRSQFTHEALRVGLTVIHHRVRGWGETTSAHIDNNGECKLPDRRASQKLKRLYREIGLPAIKFSEFQGELGSALAKRPRKEFTYKYVCKCDPPMIVRTGRKPDGPRPLHAKCCYCSTNFVLG